MVLTDNRTFQLPPILERKQNFAEFGQFMFVCEFEPYHVGTQLPPNSNDNKLAYLKWRSHLALLPQQRKTALDQRRGQKPVPPVTLVHQVSLPPLLYPFQTMRIIAQDHQSICLFHQTLNKLKCLSTLFLIMMSHFHTRST